MNSLIGFTLIYSGTPTEIKRASLALQRVLTSFVHLEQKTIMVGKSQLTVWGHNNLDFHLHRLPDGSLLALIGFPIGKFSWADTEAVLLELFNPVDFVIPWDGRVILLKIDPDGNEWTMWNDWLGSIPVFYTTLEDGRIASTLEPVTVAAAGFSADDIFVPALLSLLVHGHFLSDWTLFNEMQTLLPDCVAKWDAQGFHFKQFFTVTASEERWEYGWDDLIDEAHELSRQAISDVLKMQSSWILPLSGGLDSRLIAAVGAEFGVKMYTYTFGGAASRDVLYARQVARTLDLSWQRIGLDADYLIQYTRLWVDMFGSSMHFHGMHQMVFFDALQEAPIGLILSGFLGEALAGYDVRFMVDFHTSGDKAQIVPDSYVHWNIEEVKKLLKIPVDDAFEELTGEIKKGINSLPGVRFQQLRHAILWSRQRAFTNFSSSLADYWRGVNTPFLNRDYARFWYSMPRAVLDDRRLFADMFQRYYPGLSAVPSTYWRPSINIGDPLQPSIRYFLKRRLAAKLPKSLCRGPLQEFAPISTSMELESLRTAGQQAVWPIYEAWDNLAEWVDLDQLKQTYQVACNGNSVQSVRKLQSIQALAYRLLDT